MKGKLFARFLSIQALAIHGNNCKIICCQCSKAGSACRNIYVPVMKKTHVCGIVGGKTIMDAFFGIEELEESAKIACMIETDAKYDKIG